MSADKSSDEPSFFPPIRPPFRIEGNRLVWNYHDLVKHIGFWPRPYFEIVEGNIVKEVSLTESLYDFESCCRISGPKELRLKADLLLSRGPFLRNRRVEPDSVRQANLWLNDLPTDLKRVWLTERLYHRFGFHRPGKENQRLAFPLFPLTVQVSGSPALREMLLSNPVLTLLMLRQECRNLTAACREPIAGIDKLARRSRLEILESLNMKPTRQLEKILRRVSLSCCTPTGLHFIQFSTFREDILKILSHCPVIRPGMETLFMPFNPLKVLRHSIWVDLCQQAVPQAKLKNFFTYFPDPDFERRRPFSSLDSLIRLIDDRHNLLEPVRKVDANFNYVNFPPPPFPGEESIVPIRSSQQLQREGIKYRNCLRYDDTINCYLPSIMTGEDYFYRVKAPVSCLLHIVKPPDSLSWKVRECRGPNNISVDSDLSRQILRKLMWHRKSPVGEYDYLVEPLEIDHF